MKLADFTYNLPDELIAKYPPLERSSSRLLVTDSNFKYNQEYNQEIKYNIEHKLFNNIVDKLNPGDILVLNNTKVMPARFYGVKPTGAKIEFLLERIICAETALVHIKANRAPKAGARINLITKLPDNSPNTSNSYKYSTNTITYSITVISKQDNLYVIKLNPVINDNQGNWQYVLDQVGSIPLPPYIDRNLDKSDQERYQTVFAKERGAVAAPTAGLHFDQELLNKLADKGVIIQYITLHVGSGTFAPVRVDNIKEHKMHSEYYSISQDVINNIVKAKQNNNRVISVGTTSLRCLESIAKNMSIDNLDDLANLGNNGSLSGDTDIFIYPGFKFKLVDSLITNFHLPGSTLMMLVSAFSGCPEIKYYYQQAIEQKYRFYSYGDAMWLDRKEV